MSYLTPELIGIALYGLLSLGGGIMGYLKSKSKVSLISGSISGILLFALAAIASLGYQWAITLSAIIIAMLIVVFAVRFRKTRKFMPSVPMIFFGVLSLGLILS